MQPSQDSIVVYLHWLKERGLDIPPLPNSPSLAERNVRTVCPAQRPRIAFVGPGLEAGEARQLLDKMIGAMQLAAQQACVIDPSDGRPLAQVIAEQGPEVVVALGEATARTFFGEDLTFGLVRGRIAAAAHAGGCEVLATDHPSDLIKTPALKRQAWADLNVVMARLGLGGKPRG